MSYTITASDLARAAARLDRWGAEIVSIFTGTANPNEPVEWCDIRAGDHYLGCCGDWDQLVGKDGAHYPQTVGDALRVLLAVTHNPDGTPCGDEQPTPTDTTTPAAERKVEYPTMESVGCMTADERMWLMHLITQFDTAVGKYENNADFAEFVRASELAVRIQSHVDTMLIQRSGGAK
jgi:hypothetical protein